MSHKNRDRLDGRELILSDRPTVTSGEASAIMGFSRWTFMRRLQRGLYPNIGRCKTRGGWIFDMENVLRTAFPSASDDQISVFMKEYRREFMMKRRGFH